eukprot:contig_13728_g3303
MQYCGLPLAHAVTDLWTEQHSQNSFGSVVVRYVEPKTTTMVVLRLGIGLFVGMLTNDVIMRWFTYRLLYFGLEVTDLASTTTDSGANVRKAMRRLPVPWLPCMSHSLHNSAVYALGGGSASTHQDDLLTTEMSATRSNPVVKKLVSETRKLSGHFFHSDRSTATYRALVIPGETEARNIIADVPTRWSSTCSSVARLYTSYPRMMAFFNSGDVGARAMKHRLSSNDWNRLRQILGVLKGAMEVSTRSQSSADPVSVVFAALCSFRRAMNAGSFVVPCPPRPSLAAGKESIDAYCRLHPAEQVIEIDNRLYHAERLHYTESSGNESLCNEAKPVVTIMRAQINLRFFNKQDVTRNLLESPSVLMSTLVTPGCAKLFKVVARMLEAPSAYDKAVTAFRDTCDRLMEPAPSSPTAAAATGSPRQGTAHAAWTSLPVFTDEDTMDAEVPACSGRAAMAKEDVEECLKLIAAGKATTPLAFWKENKARFRSLHVVACSVLGAVATSAASERDFSMAANSMRKDRSSMLARHLEMHCLIKDNVHLLPGSRGEG